MRPRPAKRCPRGPKKVPRAGPGPPKRSQEPPDSAPKPAKRAQRVAPTPPKPRSTSPKTGFEHNFCGKLCLAGSGCDFISFFALRATRATCENHRKTLVFPRFLRIRSLREKQARAHQKTLKKKAPGPKNPARTVPKPIKFEPGTPRDAPKPSKSDNKRCKIRKMRPRSAQEPKMTPTWLSRGLTNFGSVGRLGPP